MPPKEVIVGSIVSIGEVPQLEKSLIKPPSGLATVSISSGVTTTADSALRKDSAASCCTEIAGIANGSIAMEITPG